MSEKNSAAKKRFWAAVPKEKRTAHMTKIANTRWASITPEDRRVIALKMVAARKKKSSSKRSRLAA